MANNVRVNVTVNGEARESEVEPRLLLVHYLRDTLGLTGTHIGCDTSNCGACTVLVDDEAVKSCTMLAAQGLPDVALGLWLRGLGVYLGGGHAVAPSREGMCSAADITAFTML